MKRQFSLLKILAILVPLLGLAALAATIYTANLEKLTSQHETILLGQESFLPGEQSALRLVVRDSRDAKPLAGAQVHISLQPSEGGKAVALFSGETDAGGTVQAALDIPADARPAQTLRIDTISSLGADYIERPVRVERTARVLLTSDKPVYQPGQVIHMRALALDDFNRQAASGQSLEFTVSDGKGNKVFRQKLTTSEFGVAAVDFQLADEVNLGQYKIEAVLDGAKAEKTVDVKRYTLPKFAIALQPEKSYYLPGETVRVALQAEYFYGKPVGAAQVLVQGYTFDVSRRDVFQQVGETDAAGNFAFEFNMPDFLAGSELEQGLGRFYLEARVTDRAAQQEVSNISLPVAQQALIIEAIPESGVLRPGLENILYVLVSYPDGTPAESTLTVSGVPGEIETGPGGLAQVRLTPGSDTGTHQIKARSPRGETAERSIELETGNAGAAVLLRPDRPVYQVGETMLLDIFTTSSGMTAYLDIVKGKQTLSTRALELREGSTQAVLDLAPEMAGTLELHAYVLLPDGNYVRDTRLVVVNQADELQVTLAPACSPEQKVEESCIFRPGDPVGLDVTVQDAQGAGVRAALGLAIVDESVFALVEQDPGFERLYFLLEEGLLEPAYDIHGYSLPEMVDGKGMNETQAAVVAPAIRGAAFASLAAVLSEQAGFALQVNSHVDAVQRVAETKNKQFNTLASLYSTGCMLLTLAVVVLSIIVLAVRRRFWISLGALALTWLGVFGLIFLLGLIGSAADYRTTTALAWILLIGLGLAYLVGLISLIVRAITERDVLLGWTLGLVSLFVVLLGCLYYTASEGRLDDYSAVIGAILSLLVMVNTILVLIFGAGVLKPAAKIPPALPLVLLASLLLSNCQAMPFEPIMSNFMPSEGAGAPQAKAADENAAGQGQAAPRLRQYFPETLLWLPEAVTGADGRLHLDFNAADSITTWRMSALASTTGGQLGSTSAGLRVFQDFFIDLDLPLALTVGDEVAIPVGVFNYLEQEQQVRLEVQPAGWFELLDEPVKEITIGANDIQVVYFWVRAAEFGLQPFQVEAWGSQMSDAVLKRVQVYPNGALQTFSQSDFLAPEQPRQSQIVFPQDALPGTQTLLVKVYPGVLSQVVEGLESLLRMPYGCFEQTSSTTYPNVLVLDYLKSTGQISPAIQFTAEGYINQGYQRLTTFEVKSSGGFSLFGNAPADRMLTAYGLQEFSDMSRVHAVDPAILDRAASWLLEEQAEDGSWANDRGLHHEAAWHNLANGRLPVTAYIAWSLVAAGYSEHPGTQLALQYVAQHQQQAEQAYVLAIVANALAARDLAAGGESSPATEAVLERLAALAVREDGAAYWPSQVETYMGGGGTAADVETTALAALALMRYGRYSQLANEALVYLTRSKDDFGTWYSTLSTVMSLKALIESTRGGSVLADAEVDILLNGELAGSVRINAGNYDVMQIVSLADLPLGQENILELRMQGEGHLAYQVVGGYYLPWSFVEPAPGVEESAELRVIYDRSELAVGETVRVDVRFAPTAAEAAISSAMVEIGMPPGFGVVTQDLDALVETGASIEGGPRIERYELAGRRLLLYVSNVTAEYPLTFSFKLRARFPLRAQTSPSVAYDYYNPEVNDELAPQVVEVK